MRTEEVKLEASYAASLLMKSDRLSVVRLKLPGPAQHMLWARERVLATMAQYGCTLSGPLAREAKHGLTCITDEGWLFIETQHD